MSASRQDQRATLTARTGAPLSHVLLYFVLAYAISWACVIPLAATGHTDAQGRGCARNPFASEATGLTFLSVGDEVPASSFAEATLSVE